MNCPHCDQTNMILRTERVRSQGVGHAPLEIEVLVISCPSCDKALGVLPVR